MASLAKWLSVRLRIKWLWVRVPLQSLQWLNDQMFNSTFRELKEGNFTEITDFKSLIM